MRRFSLVIILIVVQVLAAPLTIAARQSEPAGTPAAGVVPARPRCDARQASAAGLVTLLREPVPDDPLAVDPRGDPLPPAERAPIGEVVARWSRCLASGNIRGLLGLFTADGVRRLLAEREPYVGGPAGLTVSVLAVGDVQRLADGRIAARVTVDPSGSGTAALEMLTFVIKDEGGAWRIDNLRGPRGSVSPAGAAPRDPDAPSPPLLRRPIAPGPNVPIQAPGPVVPMRGGNAARSGYQPGPLPEEEPQEVWRAPAGWHSDAQPIVARGLVYFGGFSIGERLPLLEAIDTATGGVRWQTTAPVAWAEFSDAPALAADVLFAPVEAPVAGVLAVAAGAGQALWFAPFGFTSVTAPALDAGSVYVSGWGFRNSHDRVRNDTSGSVFALDQRTGREHWRFLAAARFGPVALGGRSLFVPSDHGLYAIDKATGQKLWQARFSPGANETATAIGELVVFAGSEVTSGSTGIFALDAASGALRWRVDLPAVPGARAGTAASGDTVYVTWWDSPDGQAGSGVPTLRAYDLASGEERWVFRADVEGAPADDIGVGSITEPVIAGESILFGVAIRVPAAGATGTLDGLYAVDSATGEIRWHASATTPIGSPPAVLDGVIYAMGGLRPRGDADRGSLIAFAPD